jgi:hypothetical protein
MRGAAFPDAFPDDKWRRLWGVDEADLPELWTCNDDFPKHSPPPLARDASGNAWKIARLVKSPQKYCNGSAQQAGILVSGKRMWAPSNEKTRS